MERGTYFISHSYKDSAIRDMMIAQMPEGVEAFIFPPIDVEPHQLVSNELIKALLQCDGLIYIDEAFSSQSFWVALERDYALRAGKTVYGFRSNKSNPVISPETDSTPGSFFRHEGKAIDLPITYTATVTDLPHVKEVLDFMHDERNFESIYRIDEQIPTGANFAKHMRDDNHEHLVTRKGYKIMFWSSSAQVRASNPDSWLRFELDFIASLNLNNRIVFAFLEPSDLPTEFNMHPKNLKVQLWSDDQLSQKHRIDDLIVRLYWLRYRDTTSATHE